MIRTMWVWIFVIIGVCNGVVRQGFPEDLKFGLRRIKENVEKGLEASASDYLPREITENVKNVKWYLAGGHNTKLQTLPVS